MGRLFWKIFLSFWLTMILTNLGIAWVMAQFLISSDNKLHDIGLPRMKPQLQAVSSVLEHSGDAATKELLKSFTERSPFKIFVVDEQGKELLGRALPESYFTDNEASNRKTEDVISPSKPNSVAIKKVATPEGKQYTLFIEFPTMRPAYTFLGRPHPFAPPMSPYRDPILPILRLGMALLLSGAICFWLAWYLAKPVQQLRIASRKIANGDLDVRISQMIGSRRDEIADLGRDFDHMAGRLQLIISQQKQLIQDISHELRSPLARLQVAMELTRKKVQGTADRELDRIEREANRLESLVAQLLTLARLEENKTEKLDEHIDIADLLQSIVNDAEYEAVNRNCRIHINCKIRPILNANGELLMRALENIIRNAVKYTADSTSVNIVIQDSEKRRGWLELSVCDHGPGVPEEQLSNLFEPFVRIAESRDRNSGGYGLGLAIAKRAIQLHGGHISAQNCVRTGLCVEVFLPLK